MSQAATVILSSLFWSTVVACVWHWAVGHPWGELPYRIVFVGAIVTVVNLVMAIGSTNQ